MLAPWQSRSFFERYFYGDPAFVPGHVCAAFDGSRPVSCAQIIPKTIRLTEGRTATVAGIGQVWTEPEHRRKGIAPLVLRKCVDVMQTEGFALSMMFASRFDFYGALGWVQYVRPRNAITQWPEPAEDITVRPFDAAKDMAAVRRLYDDYCASVPGTTVRDTGAWGATLYEAPDTFVVAERAGDIRAYMRGKSADGTYVITEYAYAEPDYDAIGSALGAHGQHAADIGFMTIDMVHDPQWRTYLQQRGSTVNTVEDPFIMWRILDPDAVGLHGDIRTTEDERAGLEQILPPGGYTYWASDQF